MIDLSKIKNIKLNPPASSDVIEAVEDELMVKFPNVYKELLKKTNGFQTDEGVVIYGTEDLIERNLTWEVEEYAKGFVAIGDNSGGTVYLMAEELGATELLAVDSGDMNPDNATMITSDFIQWLSSGCRHAGQDFVNDKQSFTQLHDIILINKPSNDIKDVLQIKKILGVNMSTSELLKGVKTPPFVLIRGVPYGKAIKCLEELGDLSKVLKLLPSNVDV
ncbi:SMI1/KNR4 family protein [Paenibacillus elgii]|uniref:SMI1/KNR4 family protein n=1 Tax=Paenibacillus elgii TaxID=189691 RepID=UPI000248C005|nr:SMI1/KNR4 family protein [Paenibacillus elgii]